MRDCPWLYCTTVNASKRVFSPSYIYIHITYNVPFSKPNSKSVHDKIYWSIELYFMVERSQDIFSDQEILGMCWIDMYIYTQTNTYIYLESIETGLRIRLRAWGPFRVWETWTIGGMGKTTLCLCTIATVTVFLSISFTIAFGSALSNDQMTRVIKLTTRLKQMTSNCSEWLLDLWYIYIFV